MANGLNGLKQYITAVILMAVLAVVTVIAITNLRPSQDNTALITIILGFLATITVSLLNLMKTQETSSTVAETRQIVDETKLSVDGKMTELLHVTKAVAVMKGQEMGRAAATAEETARAEGLAQGQAQKGP